MNHVNLLYFYLTAISRTAINKTLPILILSVCFSGATSAATSGYPLVDNLVGSFGNATTKMKTEVNILIEDSGIEAAATQAHDTLQGLGNEAVPFIDDLKDPYQENAEQAIANALAKTQLVTNILNKIADQGAKQAIEYIQNSPLFAGADFGISTPTGRIRIHVQDAEVSICRTIVGPLGSVIITGISNAKNLCHYPDPRMANPTQSLLAFAYMAAGHTHLRTTRVLIPNLSQDLTLLPPPIETTTYVKTIGGQWVQIRLAGADPKSLELEAKFEVGLKANGSYYVDIEAETEAALKLSLKPLYAAEVIRSTGEAMLNKATSLGLDMNAANTAANTAAILKAGLQNLADIEPQYEEGFGDVVIDIKLTGGIGAGIWDTAISAVSANSTLTLTYPLHALIELQYGVLEEYLDLGFGMVNANFRLGTSVLDGSADTALSSYKTDMNKLSADFVNGVMQELLDASTQISIASSMKIAALGDADKEAIDIYESGLTIPVGDISTSLQANPNAFGDAFSAITYLMQAAIDPNLNIPEQTWTDLEQVIVPGILYTLRGRNPVTGSMIGFHESDLLETIKIIATIRNVLISVFESSFAENLNNIRSAIETTVTNAINTADDTAIAWLNRVSIEKAASLGANGTIGAEAVVELGAKLTVKGEVKASLFLLLLDLPVYQGSHGSVLSSASIPIEVSADGGLSAGEGVELTVDAGGKLQMNAFELSVTHWDEALPTPALMKVAGFSVLEFNGKINPDESLAGSGYLMLPMGGLVTADFEVDSFGNVISGSWSGGLELGPLGDYPFISGELDNNGLHGTVDVGLLGSTFKANFILNSSGLLLGSYDGTINIAGHQLAAASLYLGTDGQFNGHYEGDLELGGFVASSNLDFNNDGFSGSSYLHIFASTLVSNDIEISRSGNVSGTFTGNITAGPHTLSTVSLQAVNGGFIGSAIMDLPGLPGAEVELRIYKGKLTAFYQGELFNGLISQASFDINESGIVISANFDTSQFPGISSQVLNLVISASSLAQDQLQNAENALIAAQGVVDGLEQDISDASSQLTANLEAAQQALLDASANAQLALNELNAVIAQIDAINNLYKDSLAAAQQKVDDAQAAVNNAKSLVSYYNNKIKSLDAWYNGLSAWDKTKNLAYYTAKRAQYVTYKTSASATLAAAQLTLDAAQLALNLLNSELADLLNPLQLSKNALQTTYDVANQALITAQQELAAIEADIAADTILQPLYLALEIAEQSLKEAQALVNQLQATIAMAEFAATTGAEGAFHVLSANVTTNLNTLLMGNTVAMKARVIYLGQQGQISLQFDPADMVNSFHQAVLQLQQGSMLLTNSDVTAPTVKANQPAQPQASTTLVQLLADDAQGSGVASITYSTTGAQLSSAVTVAGDQAFALIEMEGVTSLSFYATDISGNVSATTSISVSIDNTGPQISVTPAGINEGVYEVMINAKDVLGSGIDSIAVSASGAEPFTEIIELSDEVVIALNKEGTTTLEITAIDVAGNITTIAHEVKVPDLSVIEDSSSSDNENTTGGGSLGLFWILFMLIMIRLRYLSAGAEQRRRF